MKYTYRIDFKASAKRIEKFIKRFHRTKSFSKYIDREDTDLPFNEVERIEKELNAKIVIFDPNNVILTE